MYEVKWIDTSSIHSTCWVNSHRINLFKDPGGWFQATCNAYEGCRVRFQVKGGMDAAKPITIRLIADLVVNEMKVWNDLTTPKMLAILGRASESEMLDGM